MPILNDAVQSIIWSEYVDESKLDHQPLLQLIDRLAEPVRSQIRDEYLFAQVYAANAGIAADYAAAVNPRSIMESRAEL